MGTTIIIDTNDCQFAIDYIKGNSSVENIYCLRLNVYEILKKQNNFNVYFTEDILSKEELFKIDEQTYGFIKGWYKNEQIKSVVRGNFFELSIIGNPIEDVIGKVLPQQVKAAYLAERILAEEKSNKLVMLTDNPKGTFSRSVKRLGRDFITIKETKKENRDLINELNLFARKCIWLQILTTITFVFVRSFLRLTTNRKFTINKETKPSILIEISSRISKVIRKIAEEKDVFLISERLTANNKRLFRESIDMPIYFAFSVYFTMKLVVKSIYLFFSRQYVKGLIGYTTAQIAGFSFFTDSQAIQEIFKPVIQKNIISNISAFSALHEMVQRFFKKHTPKMILMQADTSPFERILCNVSRSFGVRSIVLQHGMTGEMRGHDVVLADRFMAWGRKTVEQYVSYNNPRDKFIVTGYPEFDKFEELIRVGKDEIVKKLQTIVNIRRDRKKILYVTRANTTYTAYYYPDREEYILKQILSSLRKFSDKIEFIIKPHPRANTLKSYQEIIKNNDPGCPVHLVSGNLPEFIKISDFVIASTGSSAVVESVIIGRPVIIFHPDKRDIIIPYHKSGAVLWGGCDSSSLSITIYKVLSDDYLSMEKMKSERAIFLKEYVNFNGSFNSTENVYNYIIQELEKQTL